MKITYSKKGDPRGRHVVLTCDVEERHETLALIEEEILTGRTPDGRRIKPVTDVEDETVYFRFAEKYLDRLMLVFPEAELSRGIGVVLGRAEERRLRALPMPTYKFKGFRGKFWGSKKKDKKNFQAQGAHQIVEGNIDFLCDDMGLGKSFQFLAALCQLVFLSKKARDYRCLLVVPNNVKYTWAKAILEWFDLTYAVIDAQIQSFSERQWLIEKSGAQVVIINTEGIRARPLHADGNRKKPIVGFEYANPALFIADYCDNHMGQKSFFARDWVHDVTGKVRGARKKRWDYLCVDEFHRFKTTNAQVTYGLFSVRERDHLFMSGTPILSRPTEIWTILHKCYPETFNNYAAFVRALKKEGNKKVNGYNPDAMEELKNFMNEVTLRRRKDQVLKDLPKVVTVKSLVTMSDEQRELYEEVKEQMLLRLDDGTTHEIMGVLPQITRLKQAAFSPELYGGSHHSAKMERLKEIVAELVAKGEKAIIFSQWSKGTRIIQRELAGYNPAYVTGEEKSMLKRQAEIDKFNEDDTCHVYIGTVAANKEGINLGSATYVIFTDFLWVPGTDFDQPIGRSAAGGLRGMKLAGKDRHVTVIEIQAEDTLEEWIQDLLIGKRNIFDRMIERDGGKERKSVDVSDIVQMLRMESEGLYRKMQAA